MSILDAQPFNLVIFPKKLWKKHVTHTFQCLYSLHVPFWCTFTSDWKKKPCKTIWVGKIGKNPTRNAERYCLSSGMVATGPASPREIRDASLLTWQDYTKHGKSGEKKVHSSGSLNRSLTLDESPSKNLRWKRTPTWGQLDILKANVEAPQIKSRI